MDANEFIKGSTFIWHQRFKLDDVYTPGVNDVEWLWRCARLPEDLSGKRVLDIGTSNGGVAFEAERRGARQVVAVDIYPSHWFGFSDIRAYLGSDVEFLQANVYGLPAVLDERFDLVFFFGVLYHLRHPLLALDALRALTQGHLFVETQIAPDLGSKPGLVRFHRGDTLFADGSNWFEPAVDTLLDWCFSSGFQAKVVASWPDDAPTRCMLRAAPTDGDPEYFRLSYERPLRVAARGWPSLG
jgi:tRNA (mo5U34)-methyltransferase